MRPIQRRSRRVAPVRKTIHCLPVARLSYRGVAFRGEAGRITCRPSETAPERATGGLSRALACGTLPSIYFSDNPTADLHTYTGMYLQEEVVAEKATRNVPAFSRFLRIAALCNGTILNFTNPASNAQVPRTKVYEYFEILKHTLILFERRPGEDR